MPGIVFENKTPPQPKQRVVSAPPPRSVTKTVSAPPPKKTAPAPVAVTRTPPPPPKPGSIVRGGKIIQQGAVTKSNQAVPNNTVIAKPEPVIEPVPQVEETPVVETPKVEPSKQTVVETPVKEYNTPDKNRRVYQSETVVTDDDDDWGIMQVTKKKSPKEISKSVQNSLHKSNAKAVTLDAAGVSLLVETIVTELANQFVRKDEVYDIITKALQRMVMEDVRPK